MAEIADGPVVLVWQNAAGGLTGRVDGNRPGYIKWNPAGSGESLAAEVERLRWLSGRHPVPQVVGYHATDQAEVLRTDALPGRSAVDEVWLARPDQAVRALAVGLRRLHALPVASCPYDWGVGARIAEAAAAGVVVPPSLWMAPPVDRLVVCHGDPCAPNTLLDDAGEFLADVDFGRLGAADRWADLAVMTMSLGWNYPTYDEGLFWRTYGVEPDPVRIEYYRALWDAT